MKGAVDNEVRVMVYRATTNAMAVAVVGAVYDEAYGASYVAMDESVHGAVGGGVAGAGHHLIREIR